MEKTKLQLLLEKIALRSTFENKENQGIISLSDKVAEMTFGGLKPTANSVCSGTNSSCNNSYCAGSTNATCGNTHCFTEDESKLIV